MALTLVWFRQDLRLADHPALWAAVRRGGAIVPVYVWSPEEEGDWPPGAAARWWLHHSLGHLNERLQSYGSRLIVRTGPALAALRSLAREAGADAVFWNRRYEPETAAQAEQVASALRAEGLTVDTFNGALLHEPWEVANQQGGPYRVFTAFWKAATAQGGPSIPSPAPQRLPAPKRWPRSVPLAELDLLPRPDWAPGLREAWQPGEQAGHAGLRRFLAEAVDHYAAGRDRPDLVGTSRLSPHLHWGELSPRQVWHAVREAVGGRSGLATDPAEPFLRQLGWREFAHHLLHHFPHTPTQPLRPEFACFPWARSPRLLRAWQQGRTGYPIVDAGMLELWHTGWMHNRVRMIVASFLVKDLRIHWREGARWFWDTLVDADLANNTLGWQWTAGCGADAAPYFRIFNPISQGQRFDPQGHYVRQWVPELADVPAGRIHHPVSQPSVGRSAAVGGQDRYPAPIVDHAQARKEALAAFATLRSRTD